MVETLGLALQMSILLLVSMLGYLLATRIGQSVVIGEILVGIIIGPSVLGLVSYGGFVESLAHLGAIVLLFVVGLELKFKEVYTLRSTVIAIFGVVIPWVGGYAISAAMGYPFLECVFVGTALTATSIAITANVLREMGKLDSDAAKAIIGAAVVDDILGLLALGITVSFTKGSLSLGGVVVTAAIAVLFLVVSTAFGVLVLAELVKRIDIWARERKVPEMTFIAAMSIAFAYATIAELVGLSAIVGAFVAGLSLERLDIRAYKEGARYLEVIFAAIFFVSLGVLVNITWQGLGQVFLFVILLTVVAIVTKLVGCYLPARAMGLGHRDSLVVGLGMVPRGEVAMIVGLIGLTSGVIEQGVYSAVLLMALLTTVAMPFFIRKAYNA